MQIKSFWVELKNICQKENDFDARSKDIKKFETWKEAPVVSWESVR